MNLRAVRFLQLTAAATALPAVPRVAGAQAYPAWLIHLIVPVRAGRRVRHHRAHHRAGAVGTARPAGRYLNQAGAGAISAPRPSSVQRRTATPIV